MPFLPIRGKVGRDVNAMLLGLVQEAHDLCEAAVLQRDHVLGEALNEREEAALGVEPGVSLQLLVVRLEALDDAADAKLVVGLDSSTVHEGCLCVFIWHREPELVLGNHNEH